MRRARGLRGPARLFQRRGRSRECPRREAVDAVQENVEDTFAHAIGTSAARLHAPGSQSCGRGTYRPRSSSVVLAGAPSACQRAWRSLRCSGVSVSPNSPATFRTQLLGQMFAADCSTAPGTRSANSKGPNEMRMRRETSRPAITSPCALRDFCLRGFPTVSHALAPCTVSIDASIGP